MGQSYRSFGFFRSFNPLFLSTFTSLNRLISMASRDRVGLSLLPEPRLCHTNSLLLLFRDKITLSYVRTCSWFLRNNIHWSIGWRDKWPWKTEIGAPICNLPAVVYPAAMPLPHSSPLKPVDEPKVHFCPPSWWSVVASRSFFSIVYATPSESPIRPSLLSLLLLS